MQLKQEEITIDGSIYIATELSARKMLPLVQSISDSENNQEAQISLINAAVTLNGQPIDAGELGFSAFMKLMAVVQRLNGMEGAGGEEGNDLAAAE